MFLLKGHLLKGTQGNAVVEYVLAMAISSIILLGVFDLFRAMSIDILQEFISTVAQPWP